MTMHTTKGTSGKAYGFVGDDNTYVASPAADQISLVAGGTTVVTATSTTVTVPSVVVTSTVDLNGVADALVLDADGNTSISAPTDNQIDVEINGADDFTFTANTFTALSGSTVKTNTLAETTAGSGVTLSSDLLGASGKSDLRGRVRCRVFEDFFADAGATLPTPWGTQDTSSAGSPTLAYVADTADGAFTLTHDSQSEQQNLTLYFADQLVIPATKKPVFECKLKVNFAGAAFTADQRIVIGLAAARNATLDSNAKHAWFRIEGANLNILKEADDGTTDTDDVDTTIDIVDNTYTTFRIDLSNTSAIGFYVDGVAAGGAAVSAAALAASDLLQPYIEIQRDAGAETEAVTIDYVMVEWDRS